jgi:hypothetical protein
LPAASQLLLTALCNLKDARGSTSKEITDYNISQKPLQNPNELKAQAQEWSRASSREIRTTIGLRTFMKGPITRGHIGGSGGVPEGVFAHVHKEKES